MCIREVTRFETNDGTAHPSAKAAEAHIENVILEDLDKLITARMARSDWPYTPLSRADVVKVVSLLAGSLEDAKELYGLLGNMLEDKNT